MQDMKVPVALDPHQNLIVSVFNYSDYGGLVVLSHHVCVRVSFPEI